MALLRQGKALALTVYLGESDQWHGVPLYIAMMQYLREQGCAGATATRAITGYGGAAYVHTHSDMRWSSDDPVVLQVVDQPDRLRRLIPHLQEMMTGGLMTVHEVEVVKYTHARVHGLPASFLVRQVMATAVTTVGPSTPVAEVTSLLLVAPFRALPVVDEHEKLAGIIGTADLIRAGVLPVRRGVMRVAQQAEGQAASTIEGALSDARHSNLVAADVMNRQVQTVGPDQTIREAARIMLEASVRRLPVVSADGMLRGMLTRSDLLQVVVTSPIMNAEASSATQSPAGRERRPSQPVQQQPITKYMRADVSALSEEAPLADVIDALLVSPWKRVVITDAEQRVTGIISDVDVLQRLQDEHRPGWVEQLARWARGNPARPSTGAGQGASDTTAPPRVAREVMNRQVVMVRDDATVQETIELMMSTGRKVLPVVNSDTHLLGIVGRSDVLRILTEEEASA